MKNEEGEKNNALEYAYSRNTVYIPYCFINRNKNAVCSTTGQ